jgi:hypothetical protein
MQVNILVEGITDEPVAKKLLAYAGLEFGQTYGRKGKPYVLERAPIYNKAAKFAPWFVLVDLDSDIHCPSEALALWLPDPTDGMRFRVAVRAIEAWLMAERESIADFLGVSLSRIPNRIDQISNPKQTLVNIARMSHSRSIQEDIVPRQGSGVSVGPLYVRRLIEYTEKYWRPGEGEKNSESLCRCIKALSTLVVSPVCY